MKKRVENRPGDKLKRILILSLLLPLLTAIWLVFHFILGIGISWIDVDWIGLDLIISFIAPPINVIVGILALIFLIKYPKKLWALAISAIILNAGSAMLWIQIHNGLLSHW